MNNHRMGLIAIIIRITGIIALLIIFQGCRHKESIKEGDNEIVVRDYADFQKKASFQVTLYALVDKSDVFKIFYSLDSLSEPYREEQSIRIKVEGKSDVQQIVFDLPEGVKPEKFRIDLGIDSSLTEIVIRKVEISYHNKGLIIPGNILPFFFDANEDVAYNSSTCKLKLMNTDNRRNPFLLSSALLNKKMKIEF